MRTKSTQGSQELARTLKQRFNLLVTQANSSDEEYLEPARQHLERVMEGDSHRNCAESIIQWMEGQHRIGQEMFEEATTAWLEHLASNRM